MTWKFLEIWSLKCRRVPVGLYGCDNNYDALLEKIHKSTIEQKRLKTLAIEIYKSINNISPSFMRQILKFKSSPKISPFGIIINAGRTTKY